MGHHKKNKRDRTYNNNNNPMNNIDLESLSAMLNNNNSPQGNSNNQSNNNIGDMLNNIDLQQLMSQLSSNSKNEDARAENPSNYFLPDNDPTINLLNSMKPFIARDNPQMIDNMVKFYIVKNILNNPSRKKD